jgi:hypothetical protein
MKLEKIKQSKKKIEIKNKRRWNHKKTILKMISNKINSNKKIRTKSNRLKILRWWN